MESACPGSGFEQMLSSNPFLEVALSSFSGVELWSIQVFAGGSPHMEPSLSE